MTTTQAPASVTAPPREPIELRAFLETVPPPHACLVEGFEESAGQSWHQSMKTPPVWLWCNSEECRREGWYDPESEWTQISSKGSSQLFIRYRCRHCKFSSKRYAVGAFITKDGGVALFKFGETPEFGEHLPDPLQDLVGRDDYFKRAWRAERLGLGIGAFAYYRRVVEAKKNELFDLVRAVAEKEGADSELLEQIDAAKAETQFQKGVERIKAGLPSSLRFESHSPLELLHEALSEGLHNDSDEQCLQLAGAIRRVLAFLTEKAAAVAQHHGELKDSVSMLLKKQRERRERKTSMAPGASPQPPT